MLRLGFIGCRLISGSHMKGLADRCRAGHELFQLVAVRDSDRVRAEQLARHAISVHRRHPLIFTALESATIGHQIRIADIIVVTEHAYDDAVIAAVEALARRPRAGRGSDAA